MFTGHLSPCHYLSSPGYGAPTPTHRERESGEIACRTPPVIASTSVRTILIIHAVIILAVASFAQQTNRPAGVTYELGPDSLPQPGVPKGKLEGPFLFKSQIITNTVRRYWIYVP